MRLTPIAWIWLITYCLPVKPMVTTTIRDAVPITMPVAVSAKRTLLERNESMAMLTISLKSMVLRAVPVKGLIIGLLWHKGRLKPKALSQPTATDHHESPQRPSHGDINENLTIAF